MTSESDTVNALTNAGLRSAPLGTALLVRIVQLLNQRIAKGQFSADLFACVPSTIYRLIPDRDTTQSLFTPNKITICQPINGQLKTYQTESELTLPSSECDNQLLIFLHTDELNLLVSAKPENGTPLFKEDSPWTGVLTFSRPEIQTACKIISAKYAAQNAQSDVTEWWRNISERISQNSTRSGSLDQWGDFLTELILLLEQNREKHEQQLNWYQLIANVQDAVGWELEPSQIFTSISHVLKKTIGYDYLEMHIYEAGDDISKAKYNFQQNDTSFGGPLFSILLQPNAIESLIKGQKPVLVEPNSAVDILVNPLLLKFMGLGSGIIIPLMRQNECNGFIKLFSQDKNHYTALDIARMTAIGNIVSRTIDNVRTHINMRRMATMDGLTGIYNHRFFMDQLARELKRSIRYNTNLTMIMIDIDFFKNYNDNNGHLQGDQVLKVVARMLLAGVRSMDLVARYGGEEFAIILPETTLEQGLIVAEKVRQSIEDYQFKNRESQPNGRVTLSLGIATTADGVDHPTELINRADTALYEAKKTGRNRCVVYKS